jgi:hypothetical protein
MIQEDTEVVGSINIDPPENTEVVCSINIDHPEGTCRSLGWLNKH